MIDIVGKWVRANRMNLVKGAVALAVMTSVSIGGNHYVEQNTIKVYHVSVDQQEIGTVSDPAIVAEFLSDKKREIESDDAAVRMVMDPMNINFSEERGFHAKSDDNGTLKQLDELVQAHAVGTKLMINGKTVAIVKDQQTAAQILQQIKDKYIPKPEETSQSVSIASANGGDDKAAGKSQQELESVEFTQNVRLVDGPIDPSELATPENVRKTLETGDVQPMKYIVQKGDCISCIAEKFDISKQVIYDNNPWIVDDMIQIGDELDITVLQPELSVKTTLKLTENQEMQYVTEYQQDPDLRAGKTVVIKPGKNGLKRVTYQVTKINGIVTKEELVQEEVLLEPVTAVVKKGTKIIPGEGTGRFAWPVHHAQMTSSYGKRWGTFHKGVDLVSSDRSILAADNGVIVFSGVKHGYGNCIIIDHKNGYQTLYGHMSKLLVSKGTVVEKGEKIGIMGATGDATGVHLHFEVHVNGGTENPIKYLNK